MTISRNPICARFKTMDICSGPLWQLRHASALKPRPASIFVKRRSRPSACRLIPFDRSTAISAVGRSQAISFKLGSDMVIETVTTERRWRVERRDGRWMECRVVAVQHQDYGIVFQTQAYFDGSVFYARQYPT